MKKVLLLLCLFVAAFTVTAQTALDEGVKTAIVSSFNEELPQEVEDGIIWESVDFAPNDYLRYTFVSSDAEINQITSPELLKHLEKTFGDSIIEGFSNDPDTSKLMKLIGTGLQVVMMTDDGRVLFSVDIPASDFK